MSEPDAYGIADIVRRAMPPHFGKIDTVWWPARETIVRGGGWAGLLDASGPIIHF